MNKKLCIISSVIAILVLSQDAAMAWVSGCINITQDDNDPQPTNGHGWSLFVQMGPVGRWMGTYPNKQDCEKERAKGPSGRGSDPVTPVPCGPCVKAPRTQNDWRFFEATHSGGKWVVGGSSQTNCEAIRQTHDNGACMQSWEGG